MQSKEKGGLVWVRLFPGEDVHESLKEACARHDVSSAVVVSAVGQLRNFELGYFKAKGDYAPEKFAGPHELLSLSGNIVRQGGEYIPHLHAVVGDAGKRALGGHLIKGEIELGGEIVMLKSGMETVKFEDMKTGLKWLKLE